MEHQLVRRTSSDVLNIILATLKSLEIQFDNQNMRLGTIETSIVSSACSDTNGSPNSPCSHHLCRFGTGKHTEPAFPAPEATTDHPTAAKYMASVMELQKRFLSHEQSSSQLQVDGYEKCRKHESMSSAYDDNDWYSQSVYSSRPLSRLELEIPPPSVHAQWKGQGAPPNIEPLSQDQLNRSHEVFDIYQHTTGCPANHRPITPPQSFSSASRAQTSLSDTQESLSTRQTSISIEADPSSTESKRHVSRDLRSAYNNIKQSFPQASQYIKRTFSQRAMSIHGRGKQDEEPSKPDIQSFTKSVDFMVPVTIIGQRKRRLPFFQMVERTVKSCRTALPNMWAYVTRDTYFIPL